MSFLKQLLNPFIEFDEDTKNKKPVANTRVQAGPQVVPPAKQAPQATAPPPAPDEPAEHPLISGKAAVPAANQVPTYSPGGTIAGPLPEHHQYFEKLIEEANNKNPLFQGTDFKEFVDSKVDINDITDETVRYKTAFNVLKSTGLTKDKLISTGQEYLNIIGRDLNAFQSAHAQQYKKEVGSKEALIQKKAEELQNLTQRINALKTEINGLTQEINLTKDKLSTVKNSFLLAGEIKQKEIQSELEKIQQYF
jgi:cell division protein FtsB